jgi:hypothetical protein
MYGVWRSNIKHIEQALTPEEALAPMYEKGVRLARRVWFKFLRNVNILRDQLTKAAARIFFWIFPKARKAFETKDELTGLEHGPSSYFLMSVSESKKEFEKDVKKNRRNRKNV